MECRAVRELADSFVGDELLVERIITFFGILRPVRSAGTMWRRAWRTAVRQVLTVRWSSSPAPNSWSG